MSYGSGWPGTRLILITCMQHSSEAHNVLLLQCPQQRAAKTDNLRYTRGNNKLLVGTQGQTALGV